VSSGNTRLEILCDDCTLVCIVSGTFGRAGKLSPNSKTAMSTENDRREARITPMCTSLTRRLWQRCSEVLNSESSSPGLEGWRLKFNERLAMLWPGSGSFYVASRLPISSIQYKVGGRWMDRLAWREEGQPQGSVAVRASRRFAVVDGSAHCASEMLTNLVLV
jgi:hypothetical protein